METVAAGVAQHVARRLTKRLVGSLGRGSVPMTSLKRSMEMLRSQAMDIEDDVNREEMSCKKKMKTEVKTWLKYENGLRAEFEEFEAKVSSSGRPLIRDPVGDLQCRVNQLTEQRKHFNGLVLDDFDNNGVPCSPTKLFGNKIMETFEKIWPCLVVDKISSIGMYGMGGVGKTTLASHIQFKLEQESYRVYWVTVSQEFSITSLQDKIANVLGISLSNRDEERMRANILRAAFEKMEKSVFIFDDVWKEFQLKAVGIAIGPNKCSLILTTRSLLVCDRMLCERKFMVPTLDKDESWDLFKHTLAYATILSEQVEKIAKSVANRCAGLPLGIVTTASSMRGITGIREWNVVLEQLKSCSDGHHEMEDEVFPILEWSFNRLRGCERPCFLYCCLYPEDHEIEREQLIDLFIYAELIPRRDTMELERSDGHRILNKLVKVCLLEEAKNKRGVECVRMHDLIRDMALRITSGKCISEKVPVFLVKEISRNESNNLLLKNEERKDGLGAVSLIARSFDRRGDILKIPPLMLPNCGSLSTLIINRANIKEIPDPFLGQMYGLKVLNLEGCERLQSLPDCISEMVNLTALLLEGCLGLESVPPIGKLQKLRILNLFRTNVIGVPKGLEELANLERLYYLSQSRSHAQALPGGAFSKLHLEHLVFPAIVRISDLRMLKELQLYVGGLAYDQLLTSRSWPTHYKIRIVPLDVNKSFLDEYFRSPCILVDGAEDFIRGIRSKNKLVFEGCNFQKGLDVVFPPENLHELELSLCSGLSDVFFHRWIDGSKDLCHLGLLGSNELQFVLNLSSADDGALRNLRVIKLAYLPKLVGLVNIGSSLIPRGTFSSLEELLIERCDGLKKVFSVQLVQQCLLNLKRLIVRDCRQVEEIVEGGGESNIFHQSSSGPIASTIPELLLPKLQELRLYDLPELENVCSPTIMIGGDEPTRVWVEVCPKLKRLPSFSSVKITYFIQGSKEWKQRMVESQGQRCSSIIF